MKRQLTEDDIKALQAFWEPQNAVKPEDPQHRSMSQYYGRTQAGVRITMDTWWQASAAWGCIDVIAKTFSSSDVLLFERLPNRRRKELVDDRLVYLLNTRPNPEMTAQAFKRALLIAACSWGNGYAEIVRDLAGRVAALYPIAPDRVEARRDSGGNLGFWVRNDDGTGTWLQSRDMFQIRGPSIIGMMGDNAIARASGTLALALATQKFAEAYFGNGATLGGVIEYPGELDDKTFERLEKAFNGRHQGAMKAFRTAWIEQGMKYVPVESDAESAQLVTARQQDIEDICRYWGVPPHKIQHLLRATNNNIEHQGLEFVRDCMRPWAKEFQQEADAKLLSERGPVRFTEVDLDWATEGDFKSRMEGLQIGRNMGCLNGNEVRAEIGYDDMGPEGDIYIVQGAMVPLKDVGAAYKKPTSGAPAKSADQEDDGDDPLAAWLGETFRRIKNRRDGRQSNLARDGKENAVEQAQREAMSNALDYLQPINKHLAAIAGRDCADDSYQAALAVLAGACPDMQAAALVAALRKREAA